MESLGIFISALAIICAVAVVIPGQTRKAVNATATPISADAADVGAAGLGAVPQVGAAGGLAVTPPLSPFESLSYRFESLELTAGGTVASSPNFVSSHTLIDIGGVATSPGYIGEFGIGEAAPYQSFAAHQIFGISPHQGPCSGGLPIRIAGVGFQDGGPSSVLVKIGLAPEFTVTTFTNTEILCTLPAGYAGDADVVVTTPCGSRTLVGGFKYVCANTPLALFSVSPSSSDVDGGTLITLSGLSLLSGSLVSVGGVPAYDHTYVSDELLTCRVPAHVHGTYDISVSNGLGTALLSNAFTYSLLARVQVVTGGCSGLNGTPQNFVAGSLPYATGASLTIVAANVRPSAFGYLVGGIEAAPYSLFGCVALVDPTDVVLWPVTASVYGVAELPVVVYANPGLAGITVMAQWAFVDESSPATFSMSNGLRIRFGF